MPTASVHVHVRLLLRDLSPAFACYDAHQKLFRMRSRDAAFSSVRVQGICTSATLSEQTCKLEIDDGTGAVQVQIDASKLLFDAQELRAGELIDCLGMLMEPIASSNMRARWVEATHVTVIKDRNAESLRMLEIIQLFQQAHSSNAEAITLALLPFPTASPPSSSTNSSGVKRKHLFSSLDQPSTANERTPKTPIEKPRDQQPTNPPLQANAPSGPATFLHPVRASVLPAAEYRFNVSASDHQHIESGVKTLEIRLNVPPYSIIRVNDRILINGRTTATVVAVRKYTQLQSVLQTESLANLLPATDSPSGASHTPALKASAAAMHHFRQFLSAVEEENHGLVVFELRVGSGAPAEPQKKTPEEWSRLLYEQLAKKRKYGCSLADLQFAFPVLPIDEIMEILTEFQMDGVVYTVQDKYLLL
ncbi:hypothetical protein Gpo141_00006502 [Globisporangium polare]